MKKPSWPDVLGPLGGHSAGYRKELAGLGYSPWTASAHMYLMADVSRWLDPAEMLAQERAALHPIPAVPHTVAFGVTRVVPGNTPMVAFEGGQYSDHRARTVVVGDHGQVPVALAVGHLVDPDPVDLLQAGVVELVGHDPAHDARDRLP